MKIPLLDIGLQYRLHKEEFDEAIQAVLEKANFILGSEVAEFERQFAAFSGSSVCIGVANGTDSLRLSFKALGVGDGDEVLMPAHTFVATAIGILDSGAFPRLVDITSDSYHIDYGKLLEAITPRTKAICPVHLYGRCCDMDQLIRFAEENNLAVVEDAAQAHGARWKGKQAGSFGNAGSFSFYPGKNLGAFGDAGCVITDDIRLANYVKQARNYGSEVKYVHSIRGTNSRLDTLQAAILSVKLKYLQEWNLRRWQLAANYCEMLEPLARQGRIGLPDLRNSEEHVFHLFVIRIAQRDAVLQHLQSAGIGAGIHYPVPFYLQEGFMDLGYKRGQFPVAESVSSEILSLPLFPEMTVAQQEYVVQAINKCMNGAH